MRKKKRYLWLKYVIEWIVSLVAVVMLSPLFLIIMILEKALDGGEIFYMSTRIGHKGKEFRLFKFRGMVKGAQPIITDDLKFITTIDDQRITPLGKILRIGFDELAQLINVLKGEMCLIGPRPNLVWERKLYNSREERRLEVLPGITGLSQILDGRMLHIRDNYEIDVRYVEKSTWLTDLLIIIFTIPYSFGFKKFYKVFFKKYLINIPCQRTIDDLGGKIDKELTKNNVYL